MTPTQRLNEIAGRAECLDYPNHQTTYDDLEWLLEEVRVLREAVKNAIDVYGELPTGNLDEDEALSMLVTALEGERR
jgi:hypothetical protein